jgi:SET domain-containing protein
MPYPSPRPQIHKLVLKRGLSGLGLFAGEEIKKGDFVIEYWGEPITDDEADRRGGKYLFNVKKGLTIDGTTRKNTARYINHTCTGKNCEPEIDGKRVYIYATKSIKPGEELTYNYGKEYWKEHMGPDNCRCGPCVEKRVKAK